MVGTVELNAMKYVELAPLALISGHQGVVDLGSRVGLFGRA